MLQIVLNFIRILHEKARGFPGGGSTEICVPSSVFYRGFPQNRVCSVVKKRDLSATALGQIEEQPRGPPGKSVHRELPKDSFSRQPRGFSTVCQTFLTPLGSLGHLRP